MSVPVSEASQVLSPPTVNPHRSFGFLAFLAWAAILGLVVPGLLVVGVPDQGRSTAWVLSIVVVVWSGLRIAVLLGQGEARFFTFFFWLFTYVFMGVAPTIQIRSNQPATTTPDVLPSLDNLALTTVLLGIACFEIGSFLASLTKGPGRAARAARAAGGVHPSRSVALWVVAIAVSVYYVSTMGVGTFFTSRDAAAAARARFWPDPPVRSVVQSVSTYAPLVAVGALTLLRRNERRLGVQVAYLLMIGLAVFMLAIVVSPYTSARYPLGTVVFALAVLFGAGLTAPRIRLTLGAAIVGLFFVFPLADAFRRDDRNFARAGLFGEYAGNPDYDSIWQVANALSYWLAGKAEAGQQALGVVFFFVPRSIWLNKPLDTGALLANDRGYTFTNLSAPLWAEAAINGGLTAVVIVFLAVGFLLRRLDGRVIASLRAGGLWFLAGAILPVYLMILLRGSLLQATGSTVVIAACVFLVRSGSKAVATQSPARRSLPAAPQ